MSLKEGSACHGLIISMQDGEKLSLEQRARKSTLRGQWRQEVYELLRQQGYRTQGSHGRHKFASRFTSADVELLAKVDEAHETLSEPATKKILEREWEIYGQAGYERLATISVPTFTTCGVVRVIAGRMNYT